MVPDVPRNTLPKEERLYGKKDISRLLARGKYRVCGNIRYCFSAGNGTGRNRIMVSVSKKLFRRAVKRNLLKRRIRESYRLQKHVLPAECATDIFFIYNSKEISATPEIRAEVGRILEMIGNEVRKD